MIETQGSRGVPGWGVGRGRPRPCRYSRGGIFGLDPNGAGKTTTAGMPATRVVPTSGKWMEWGLHSSARLRPHRSSRLPTTFAPCLRDHEAAITGSELDSLRHTIELVHTLFVNRSLARSLDVDF